MATGHPKAIQALEQWQNDFTAGARGIAYITDGDAIRVIRKPLNRRHGAVVGGFCDVNVIPQRD
jgi:hypothetical protein